VAIEAKPFALGFRAEHPQGLIDSIQYGAASQHPELPPADYKLAENFETGGEMRGVYSFCMCPGGIVVPTPTEDGLQCTNGMSNSRRNARFANAGIVVSVSPADFARAGFHGPLAGLEFQRHWEQEAYRLGGGRFFAPAQTIPDYLAGRKGTPPGDTSYRPGLTHADLNVLFPAELTAAIKAALRRFDQKMRGFASAEGKLIGIESRTSSPVRLPRDESLQSVSVRGLYPSGEGCGYAGGIVLRHRRAAHRRADRQGARMSYRVRTPEGELEFASLYEISNALRHGLVDGEDEVLVPGQTTWVKVAEHSALKAHVRSGTGIRPGTVLGGLELGATVASALVAVTGILAGWSYWVVGVAVLVAVWLSTRMAMRSTRVRSSNRVDSRRR
jgi:hypothetical protein